MIAFQGSSFLRTLLKKERISFCRSCLGLSLVYKRLDEDKMVWIGLEWRCREWRFGMYVPFHSAVETREETAPDAKVTA